MNASHQRVLSYDVGGSHISAGIVELPGFDLVASQSTRIDSSLSAVAVMDTLGRLGSGLLDRLPCPEILGVAFSMPGPFDYQKGICLIRGLAKYEQLYGVDFRAAISGRFPDLEASAVRFINDAAAALLGEIYAGAARGKQRVIGLTLGTGIGSAFAVAGRIVRDGPGVPPDGYVYNLPCEDGIVDDVISSRGIRKEYLRLTGEDREVREVARIASSDAPAREVMNWFGQRLGEVLLPLVESFHPDIVVLGGAIARSAPLFLPAALEVLREKEVDLQCSFLGDRAGLIGAAAAWRLGQT